MKSLTTVLAGGALVLATLPAHADFSLASSGSGWLETADASFASNIEARLRCGANCRGGAWTSAWYSNPGSAGDNVIFTFSSGAATSFSLSYEATTSTYTFDVNGNQVQHQVDASQPNQAYCKLGIQFNRSTADAAYDAAVDSLSVNGEAINPAIASLHALNAGGRQAYAVIGNSENEAITSVSGNITLSWPVSASSDQSSAIGFKFATGSGNVCNYVEPAPVTADPNATAGAGGSRGNGAAAAPQSIPALPPFGMVLLASLLGLIGMRARRN